MLNILRQIGGLIAIIAGVSQFYFHAVIALGLVGIGVALFRRSRFLSVTFGVLFIAGFFVSPAINLMLVKAVVFIIMIPIVLLALAIFGRSGGGASFPAPLRPISFGSSRCPSCNGPNTYQNIPNCARCGGTGYI